MLWMVREAIIHGVVPQELILFWNGFGAALAEMLILLVSDFGHKGPFTIIDEI